MIDFNLIEVSVFKNYFDKVPVMTMSLYEALETLAVRTKVDEVRRIEDKKARGEVKKQLFAFTPSGVFENLSAGATPLSYSGMMCVDIDKDHNPTMDVEKTKARLSGIAQVAYCGLSVSGGGLFLLVPVSDPAHYNLHYEFFSEMLMKYYGLKADPACKNIGRLRVASYDEHPYVNLRASTLYGKQEEPQMTKRPVYQPHAFSGHSPYVKDTAAEVDRYILYLCSHGIDITDDYRQWYRIGFAFVDEFGEDGRGRFHSVSSVCHKYNYRECDLKYNQFLKCNSQIHIGTFFFYCHQAGVHL